MVRSMTPNEMRTLLEREYPNRDRTALANTAIRLSEELDDRLDHAVTAYWRDGTEEDFYSGEFSVLEICNLRHCGYMDALILMNDYLKDARLGRMRILRR